jgi:hypothetical protein
VSDLNRELANDHELSPELRLVFAILHLADELDEFRKQLHDDIQDIRATMRK